MAKQFITDLKLYKRELLFLMLTIIGLYTMALLIFCIGFLVDGSIDIWFAGGTGMAFFSLILFAIFNYAGYHQSFMLALSMGRTRKEFMVSFALRQLLWFIAGYVAILLLYRLEQLVYAIVLPGLPEGLPMSFLTSWKFFIPVPLCLALITTVFGALYSRFKKKFFVVMYFWFLGFCWSFAYLAEHYKDIFSGAIVSLLAAIPAFVWVIAGLAAAAAMVCVIIRLGMKQFVH